MVVFINKRSKKDRMRPNIQRTPVSISHINRMESYETVTKSYIQHPDQHPNATRSRYNSHECTHSFIRSLYQYGSSTDHTWSRTSRHGLGIAHYDGRHTNVNRDSSAIFSEIVIFRKLRKWPSCYN